MVAAAALDEHPRAGSRRATLPPLETAELAGAEVAGRVVRLGGLTLPGGTVELAAATPARPDPPGARFSPGDAARAMGTSRRVAIPVLERLT